MRSKWKGIFVHTVLYKFANTKFKNFGSTWLNQKINIRSSVYLKKFLSRSLFIHNGRVLVNFKTYNDNYIGVKIGQLTYNRLLKASSINNVEKASIARKILLQHNKMEYKNKKTKFKNLKFTDI